MNTGNMRVETDSLGGISVPADCYYGAQTQRALEHFDIGDHQFPQAIVKAFALVKKASATANLDLGLLNAIKAEAIIQVCDEILSGLWLDEFPLGVWQSGSGTQSNMNANEVIANRANELLGAPKGSKKPVHPNDDVNLSQSSNDVFPTVMHLAALNEITQELLPALTAMRSELQEKALKWRDIIKIGRTHLMDATPMTLGQELTEFASEIEFSEQRLQEALAPLYAIALGASNIGTGLNTHPCYAEHVAHILADLSGFPIETASNKFAAIASHDALVHLSACLRTLAGSCMKIANDIRLLGSGPECGIGELRLLGHEPGSSIMPGKINPSQAEIVTMVVAKVMGNDLTVAFAGSQGQLQLNVFKPVMIYACLESITLLSDVCRSFTRYCLRDLQPRKDVIASHLAKSTMLVTALNPIIGYDRAAEAVQVAESQNMSLKQALLELGYMSAQEMDEFLRPERMCGPHLTKRTFRDDVSLPDLPI